jgi:hypothetical protein
MLQTLKGLIGLPVLAGIIYLGSENLASKVEADLNQSAVRALSGLGAGLFEAKARASGRDLTIEGLAVSQADRDKAVTAVSALEGIGRVFDATRLLGTQRPFVLGLQREGSRVVFSGFAPPGEARAKLRQAFAQLGLEVDDRAEWANGAPPVFPSLAVFASNQIAALDPGFARLSDATLSLRGVARSGVDYGKFLVAAASPPVGAETIELEVAPATVSPFVFLAKSAAGSLTLERSAPYKDIAAIRRLAPNFYPGAAITDALAPAAGAPREYSAAIAAGLRALAELRQGDLLLSDRLVTLSGEAKPGASVGTALALALPQGYGLVLNLTAPVPGPP